MKPTISIALITLGLTFPAPVVASIPITGPEWAAQLGYVYCQAREQGNSHDDALDLMFYTAQNGADFIRQGWAKAWSTDKGMTAKLINMQTQWWADKGKCGV